MTVNKHEHIVNVDVDETLVLWSIKKYPSMKTAEFNYYGIKKTLAIHQEQIDLVKSYKKRGYYVRVWSANGWRWANEVVTKLDLQDFVDHVETKGTKFLDDHNKTIKVTGAHVYIPPEEG